MKRSSPSAADSLALPSAEAPVVPQVVFGAPAPSSSTGASEGAEGAVSTVPPLAEDAVASVRSGLMSEVTAELHDLLQQMTAEQLNRYENFRRSNFKRPEMRKIMAGALEKYPVLGKASKRQLEEGKVRTWRFSRKLEIVMCGVTKVYVGELVELARTVMSERGDRGPIRPTHILEAKRRYDQRMAGSDGITKAPRLFRGR